MRASAWALAAPTPMTTVAERRNLRLNRLLRPNPLKICSFFGISPFSPLIRSNIALSAQYLYNLLTF